LSELHLFFLWQFVFAQHHFKVWQQLIRRERNCLQVIQHCWIFRKFSAWTDASKTNWQAVALLQDITRLQLGSNVFETIETIEMCYECLLQALYHRCDNILNKTVFNYFGSLAGTGCKNWHFLLISISMNGLDPFIFWIVLLVQVKN